MLEEPSLKKSLYCSVPDSPVCAVETILTAADMALRAPLENAVACINIAMQISDLIEDI